MNQLLLITVGLRLLANHAKATRLPLENVLRHHKQIGLAGSRNYDFGTMILI